MDLSAIVKVITSMREDLLISQTNLKERTENIILLIKTHSNEVFEEIQSMILMCEQILGCLSEKKTSNVELLLGISLAEATKMCESWVVPKLEVDMHFISRIPKIFMMSSLRFCPLSFSRPSQPHDYLGYFTDVKELTVIDTKTEEEFIINNEVFHYTSGLLYLGGEQFLVTEGMTGNRKRTYLLKCLSQEVFILPDLNIERMHFCMGWVDGLPAVIGGSTGLHPVGSVEVLEQEWKIHSELNVARSEATTITVLNDTYVFGGVNYQRLDAVEVWKSKKWELLPFKMPVRLNLVGVIKLNSYEVLILGGAEGSEKYSNYVWKMNLQHGLFSTCASLPINSYFPKQMISVRELNAICIIKDRIFKRPQKLDLKDYI